MPQTFRPSANTISRVSIFGAVFFIGGLAYVLMLFFRSPYVTRVGQPIEQPIPFSHELHVGGLGVDCRFCHTSVEDSTFADLPPTHTCMTCHSQIKTDSPVLVQLHSSWESGIPIRWNRVYDVADFVYFNHQVHVAKGVGCETCHGRIDQMALTAKAETLYMDWCMECHRAPEKYIRPKSEVYTLGYQPPEDQITLGRQLVKEYDIAPATSLDDCSLCHR